MSYLGRGVDVRLGCPGPVGAHPGNEEQLACAGLE